MTQILNAINPKNHNIRCIEIVEFDGDVRFYGNRRTITLDVLKLPNLTIFNNWLTGVIRKIICFLFFIFQSN